MSESLIDTKEFLLDMLHLFGVFLSSGYSTPPSYICDRESYYRFIQQNKEIEARKLVYKMKQQRLLNIQIKGNEVVLELTEKGRLNALKLQVLNTKDELSDGEVCLVSFDIPEYIRKTRNAFRNFLKKAGFKPIHQSTWGNQLDLIEPMSSLIKGLGISKWVRVYLAKEAS